MYSSTVSLCTYKVCVHVILLLLLSMTLCLQDRELSRFANETIITQVQPQNVSIKLRQGVYVHGEILGWSININFRFISLLYT